MKHLWGIALLVAAVAMNFGCGSEEELPDKPQIQPDRTALFVRGDETPGFRNLWVDTQNTETLMVRNEGLEQLSISNVFITGDDKDLFQVSLTSDTVESREVAFVVITYSPKAPGTHTASLVIESNAENSPTLTLEMAPTAHWHYLTHGVVRDSSGDTVSGAKVTCVGPDELIRPAGWKGWDVTTKSDGTFSATHSWACEKVTAAYDGKNGEVNCSSSALGCSESPAVDPPVTTGIDITIQ